MHRLGGVAGIAFATVLSCAACSDDTVSTVPSTSPSPTVSEQTRATPGATRATPTPAPTTPTPTPTPTTPLDPVEAYIQVLGPKPDGTLFVACAVSADPEGCVELVNSNDTAAVVRLVYETEITGYAKLAGDGLGWTVTDEWDPTDGGNPPDWVLDAAGD